MRAGQTAGHVELGRVDEQVLQDGEWQQQQQQECGGGGGDEEHEKQERPSSVRARTRRWRAVVECFKGGIDR